MRNTTLVSLTVAVFFVAFAASALLTARVFAYATRRHIVDVPNARSSHTRPTARGGGLAIAIVVLGGLVLFGALRVIPWQVAVALAVGGVAVAGIGWLDDLRGASASLRAAIHLAAAVWAVALLGGLPVIHLGTTPLFLGTWGWPVAAIGIMWCTNLFNFMDGVDGIAAGEALTAGAALGVLAVFVSHDDGVAAVAFLIAGAAGGFLIWNWQPAKIFMGDVGSGLLGFLFGAIAIAVENAGTMPAVIVAMLLGVFIFDATTTLGRRAIRFDRLHQAHRDHAYQRAVQSGYSHAAVTIAVIVLNASSAVLAWIALRRPSAALIMLCLEGALLAGAYWLVERRLPMRGRRPNQLQPEGAETSR